MDYFKNRMILINTKKEIEVGARAPHGSVLEPILWNKLYDDISKIELLLVVTSEGLADDLVLEAKTKEELIRKINKSLNKLARWIEKNC